MELTTTARGFDLLTFVDSNGVECSLQKSSSAMGDNVWLGCNEADPQVMSQNGGWEPVKMPKEYVANTRMHLTREQVADIIPYLQWFVDTGELSADAFNK